MIPLRGGGLHDTWVVCRCVVSEASHTTPIHEEDSSACNSVIIGMEEDLNIILIIGWGVDLTYTLCGSHGNPF